MDKKIAMFCLCALIAIFVIPTVIRAASFDCSKASTKTEKTICSDPMLSKLDEDMATAYSKALKTSDPDAVKKGQRKWLKEVLAPCIEDKVCIKKAYENRLRQLESSAIGKATSSQDSNISREDEGVLQIQPKMNESQEPYLVVARAGFDRTGYYSTQNTKWKMKIIWEQETMAHHGGSHALLFNSKIYYVDNVALRVYSAKDGNHLWTWCPWEKISKSSYVVIDPLIYKGVVYLCLWSPKDHTALVALDAEDGRILWRYETDMSGDSEPPVIYKNDIIITRGSYVISINMETKKERWKFNAQEHVWKLSLYKDTLLFGTNKLNTGMYAIDASNGKKKWNGSKNGVSLGYAPIDEGKMFIGTTFEGVNAVDIETGGLVWSQNGVGSTVTELAMDNDTIYGGSIKGLFALYKSTGKIKWINKTMKDVGPPSIAGNYLFIASHNQVTKVNKNTGQVIGSIKGLGFYSFDESITIYGNKIFVPGGNQSDFKLFCIE